jgi:hypothetical protein
MSPHMIPLVDFRCVSSWVPRHVVFAFVARMIVIGMKRTLSTARVICSLQVGASVKVIMRALGDELIAALVVRSRAALALLHALSDTVRIPSTDVAAIGILLLIILFAPLRMPSSLNTCVRDLHEPKETTLLEKLRPTTMTQAKGAVRRARSALHVRMLGGTIRFNRRNMQAHPVATTTIVTTRQVQLSHVDATICVRAQGDRTSIAVLEGAVQMSALEVNERPATNGKNEATEPGTFTMNLRSGDRAEIVKHGSDLVIRLETGTEVAAECSLTWDWGFVVLGRRAA